MKKKNLCGLGLLCVALAASACTIGDVEERAEVSMTTSTDVDPRPTLSGQTMVPDADAKGDGGKSDKEPAPAAARGNVQEALQKIVEDVQSKYGGKAGIAVAGQDEVYSAGISEPRAAWSTAKVPVAIAAERAGSADPSMISQAITFSDNAAAENLWQSLGGGQSAASAASAVLAEAGLDVQVQPTVTRPGFSAFGQTQWTVADQARFIGQLGCIAQGSGVLTAMAASDPAQSYGLGSLDNSSFKGGWGPDTNGAYEARQMGTVELNGKKVAVAIYATSPSGAYGSAQQMLSALATELAGAKVQWPKAAC